MVGHSGLFAPRMGTSHLLSRFPRFCGRRAHLPVGCREQLRNRGRPTTGLDRATNSGGPLSLPSPKLTAIGRGSEGRRTRISRTLLDGEVARFRNTGCEAGADDGAAPRLGRDGQGPRCRLPRVLPTLGGLYAWEFAKDGQPLNVRVDGRFTSNDPDLILSAAADGLGLCCLPDDHVLPLVAAGRLETVLDDWCPPFPGYHLYYPSRRPSSRAFALLVEALRWRGLGQ